MVQLSKSLADATLHNRMQTLVHDKSIILLFEGTSHCLYTAMIMHGEYRPLLGITTQLLNSNHAAAFNCP